MRRLLAPALLMLLLGTAAPGHAAVGSWTDEVGDTSATGPDLASVRVKNATTRVRITVKLANSQAGNVLVGLQPPRSTRLLMAVVTRGARSSKRLYTLSDREGDGAQVRRCRGFRATWKRAEQRVTFVVPRRCLINPSRPRVRAWVLTEAPGARDADSLTFPSSAGPWGWSPWIRRG